jgi:hypothetical protein
MQTMIPATAPAGCRSRSDKRAQSIVFSTRLALAALDVRPIDIGMVRRTREDNGSISRASSFAETPLHDQADTFEGTDTMGAKTMNRRGTLLVYVAACAVGLAAWTGAETARAYDRTLSPASAADIAASMQPADLEKAFWVCDYTATTRGIDATPIAVCSAIWDEFKQSRFGGSFEDLLAWWQVHKVAQHGALAAETRGGGKD